MRAKKLTALLICLVMLLGAMPLQLAALAEGGAADSAVSKAEAILGLSSQVHEMVEKYEPEAAKNGSDDEFATARLIVVSSGEVKADGALRHAEGYNNLHIIQYKTPEEARKAAESIKTQRGVVLVCADRYSEETEEESAVLAAKSPTGEFWSWGYGENYMNAHDFREWLLEKYGGDESALPEVKVAVISSGCDLDHDFLEDRLIPGYDFWGDDAEPQDENGMGTHYAGVIADGTFGNVKIMPLRVSGKRGGAGLSFTVLAYAYALEQGCRVSFTSFFWPNDRGGDYNLFKSIIDECTDGGMLCVVAPCDHYLPEACLPAAVERAFTVGGHNLALLPAFEAYGELMDGFAAGVSVASSFLGGGSNESLYADRSGNHVGAAHAAGAAALVFSAFPDMDPDTAMDALRSGVKEMGAEEIYTGALDLTDLLVYDPYIDTDQCKMHFLSPSDPGWTVSNDGVLSSPSGLEAGCESVLEGRGKFFSYQEVTFDYRIVGSGGSLTVKADGETQFIFGADSDGWHTATVLIPGFDSTFLGKGGISLEWVFKNVSGADAYAEVKNIVRHDTISSVFNEDSNVPLYLENDPELSPWYICEEYGCLRAGYPAGNYDYFDRTAEMTATVDLYRKARVSFSYYVECFSGTSTVEFQFLVNGEPVIVADSGSDNFTFVAPSAGTYTFTFRFSGWRGFAHIYHRDNGEVNQVYDEYQVSKLRSFLELTDENGVKNGKKIREDYDPAYVDSWGVQWTTYNNFNHKVRFIDWSNKGLVGDLDLSDFRELVYLWISNNNLTSVDVSGCRSLEQILCSANRLTSFELGTNGDFPCLKTIWIEGNQITGELDLSCFITLTYFSCQNNRLTGLNLDSCMYLEDLNCYENDLSSLDLTECKRLHSLDCRNNKLTELDLSDCRVLTDLNCYDNKLTGLSTAGNTMTKRIYASKNPLISMDVSGCTSLESIDCNDTNLTSLNVSGCIELERLHCSNNKLQALDVSGLTLLKSLECYNSNLTSLNVSGCTGLESINCSYTKLLSLDVSGLTLLKSLECFNSDLTSLNVYGCTGLESINCSNTKLLSLDVSGLTTLKSLECNNSNLTSLNVSGCTGLETLNCRWSRLASLNVSDCASLEEFDFSGTLCSEVDVSGCSSLSRVRAGSNNLTLFSAEGTLLPVKHISVLGDGSFDFTLDPNGGGIWSHNDEGRCLRGWYDDEWTMVSTDGDLSFGSDALESYTAVFFDPEEAPDSITVEPVTVAVDSVQEIVFSAAPITSAYTSVYFESLKPSVAAVESETFWNGRYEETVYCLRGVSKGNTTLIAKSTLDDSLFGFADVVVTDMIPSQIEVEPLSVYVGKTANIAYSVLPPEYSGARVEFSVADPAIASVDRYGVVTGISEGVTTVIVSSAVDPSVSGEAVLTVIEMRPAAIVADDITVDMGWSVDAVYSVLPDGAFNKNVTFEIADTSIATVNANGVVTGVSVGETTLTITSVSAPGVSKTVTVTVIETQADYAYFTLTDDAGMPDETVTLDVNLSGSYHISGFAIYIPFNNGFSEVSYEWGPLYDQIIALGGSVECNPQVWGDHGRELRVNAVLPGEALEAEGKLISVSYRISNSFTDPAEIPVDIVVRELYFSSGSDYTPIRHRETSGTVFVIVEHGLIGDIDGNGAVESFDALLLLRCSLGLISLDAEQRYRADVNRDGLITTFDALLVLRYSLELIGGFPNARSAPPVKDLRGLAF